MQISELKTGQGKIWLNATVTKLEETRTISNGQKVQNVIIVDNKGNTARLALWNELAETFQVGDYIQLQNCLVKDEYEGRINITHGRYGKVVKHE